MGSLIGVNLPDGRLIEYVTDGKGRRIGKMVNGVLTKQWIYRDQLKPVAELDGSGNLVARFIYGAKNSVPDILIRGANTYRIVSDQLGSPVLAINTANSSDVPLQVTYTAFGERTLVAGIDDWMRFGFAGGQYDPDTKLTRFGNRDYDATIGRWVSKDSIRYEGRQTNFYVYVMNDPVNSTDLSGLRTTCAENVSQQLSQCLRFCWLGIWFDPAAMAQCQSDCATEAEWGLNGCNPDNGDNSDDNSDGNGGNCEDSECDACN
jgi:RHS repeat-associated protein